MSVRSEIVCTISIVVLCFGLLFAHPATSTSLERVGRSRVAESVRKPAAAVHDWAASLADDCAKAANGGQL